MVKLKLNNTTLLIIAFAAMLLFIIVMLIFNPKNPNQPDSNLATPATTITDFDVPANQNPVADVVLVDPNLLATSSAANPNNQNQNPTNPAANSNATAPTANLKMSTTPEEKYMDIDQISDYRGGSPPEVSAPEQIMKQSEIIGASDFAAAGDTNQLMLEDGLRSYFNLNPPPFLYRLIVIANTFTYNATTGAGSFRLTVSNQQSSNDPDLHYQITFTANPAAINFTKL
jgi:hypothetical protein